MIIPHDLLLASYEVNALIVGEPVRSFDSESCSNRCSVTEAVTLQRFHQLSRI